MTMYILYYVQESRTSIQSDDAARVFSIYLVHSILPVTSSSTHTVTDDTVPMRVRTLNSAVHSTGRYA